jgi:hypothetical protein
MIARALRGALAALALSTTACVGTTGGDLFTFDAAAGGPEGFDPSRPFTTGRDYEVTLTAARVHVGAVYLNRAMPLSGAQETSCVLPGTYLTQVTRGLDVDVLSPALQAFPEPGEGVTGTALAGEVWLTGGEVDAIDDDTPVLEVTGTATKGAASVPFAASLTIGRNRAVPATSPSLPGANPICKQRVVSPIALHLPVRAGGRLVVRIDPRGWFENVDFAALERVSQSPPLYRFHDDDSDQPSRNLYDGLRAVQGVYTFDWQ